VKDDLRGGRGADDVGEPAQMGGVPARSAFVADVLPQHEGLEPMRGRCEILHRVVARPAQVAQEPGQRQGIAAVGLDPVAGLARDQRRGDDVAGHARPGEVPIQPVPARAGLPDEHQPRGLGLELPEQRDDVALSGPDPAQGHDLGAAVLRRVGDGDGLLVGVETSVGSFLRLVHT